jgi:pantetheine-phosphate adenylyltransferase
LYRPYYDKKKIMKTLAIYPGSFDPFTIGHQNILEKAERIFDEVIVAIGINPKKIKNISSDRKTHLNAIKDSRIETIKKQLVDKNVEGYIGFLTDYVREKEELGYNVVVVRGLRNGYDFDYEYNMTRFMWDQMPNLNIVCIFCDPIYMHISSSAYRAIEEIQSGAGYKYLAGYRPNPTIKNN